jgi:hypothetical protein
MSCAIDIRLMKPHSSLLASIKPRSADEFVARFVGEDAAPGAHRDFSGGAPATLLCSSTDEAAVDRGPGGRFRPPGQVGERDTGTIGARRAAPASTTST